jgi:hypothetical protein
MKKIIKIEIRDGDLVLHGSYYGIVVDPFEKTVFLSNGLCEILSDEDWGKLEPVGLYHGEKSPPANFIELVNAYKVRRDTTTSPAFSYYR